MLATGLGLAILINSKANIVDPAFAEKDDRGYYTACDYAWAISFEDSEYFDAALVQWSPISEYVIPSSQLVHGTC